MKKSHKYDELYEKAKVIMDKYNPCMFDNKTSLCIRNALKKSRGEEYQTCGCCGHKNGFITGERCKHFKKGIACSVKSLACKTWLCEDAKKNLPSKELQKLDKICEEALFYSLYKIRASKKEALCKEKKMKKKCLLITYHESGDEIHFILVDIKHKDYINKILSKIMSVKGKIDDIDEMIDFIHENKIASEFVQTYTSEKWFSKFEIEEVIHIPQLGE